MREEFFERLAYSSRLVEGRYDDREANGAVDHLDTLRRPAQARFGGTLTDSDPPT